jgi:zinc and cadmium transporter
MILEAMSGVVLVQAAAVGGAWSLRARERLLRAYLPLFVSVAVGVLLATAMLHLLPEAIGTLGNGQAVWMLVGGTVLGLFCVERAGYALTGASAEPEGEAFGGCAGHGHASRPENILGASMLHSFVDGAAVATAFAAGARVGWLTALAIALHEIPHRMGDYALFVHLRVPGRKALGMAVAAGAPSLLGVAAVGLVGLDHAGRIGWLLPVSAGSFLYIALVNLLPEIRPERAAGRLAGQLACLMLGVALVVAAGGVLPF